MQISSIRNAVSFSGYGRRVNNESRISELNQQHARIQAASEGFNASLSVDEARELELRREKQSILDKCAALQWATEGCNASLSTRELARLEQINLELDLITPEKCECPKCVPAYTSFEDNRTDDIRYFNW